MFKKSLITALAAIAAVSVFFITVSVINNIAAARTAKTLKSIPLPAHTEYIESISDCGKLVGSGNGMQYFGAILIQSELTAEELHTHYSAYVGTGYTCRVEKQSGRKIQAVEHGSLEFRSEPNGDACYIVYVWDAADGILSSCDIRSY